MDKPNFDTIAEYRKAPFFRLTLRVEQLLSLEILRQRLQAMLEKICDTFRSFTLRRHAGDAELLSEELHGTDYSVMQIDVQPMDQSKTEKKVLFLGPIKARTGLPRSLLISPPPWINVEQRIAPRQCPL